LPTTYQVGSLLYRRWEYMRDQKITVEGEHEFARYLPKMSDQEFNVFKADIKQRGQQVPIVIYRQGGGKFVILDGRHRQRACKELGITPIYEVYQGKKENLLNHVISLNIGRRHLNESQRAAIAVEVLPLFQAQAKTRQRGGRGGAKLSAKMRGATSGITGKASEQAARVMNISPRLVESARRLQTLSPELFEEVKAGRIKVSRALNEVQRRTLRNEDQGESKRIRVVVFATGEKAERLEYLAEGQLKDVQLSRNFGSTPTFTVTEVYDFKKPPAD
jgi:ParB-like chromosome segregation protein Spo0J